VFQEKSKSSYGPIPSINHAVVITGWDDAKGAWRVRNSWGTGWGENGSAWVKYNNNAIGWDTVWAVAKAPH
jgi:cathepsin K